MKKKLIYIIVPIIVLLVGAAAILVTIMMFKQNSQMVFSEKITTAQKYLSNSDYDNAILYYKEAIRIDSNDEDAYLGLAEAYYKSGQYDNAIKTLEVGYDRTKSERIKERLESYRNRGPEASPEQSSGNAENMDQNSGSTKASEDNSLRINDFLFDMISSYDNKKYTEKYSVGTSISQIDGDVKVTYSGLDLDFYYKNTDGQTNIDMTTGNPTDNAFAYKAVGHSLSVFLSGTSNGFELDDVKGILGVLNANVIVDSAESKRVIDFNYKGCHIKIECDENNHVSGNDAWNVIYLPEKTDEQQKNTFRGNIKNATNYQPVVSSITIKARSGFNNRYGEIEDQCVSTDGSFDLNLPVGDHTLELEGSGYIRDYYNVHVSGGAETQKDIVISPVIGGGTIRVVLTWGSIPRDLDGHLTGTTSSGDNIHVFFANMVARNNAANLDVDHIFGNGCETITINDINGHYEYFIDRYSYDGAIGSSGAVVKIYTGDGRVITITPPAGVDAKNWPVFNIESGEITDINGVYN